MTVVQVTLNGITFNNDVADGQGTKWWIEDWDGWDSPPVRQSLINKSTRHGSYRGESLYGSRSIVLRGFAKCSTENGYYNSWDALTSATNLVDTDAQIVVTETVYTKRCAVLRSGNLRIKQVANLTFRFEIPLVATDPAKYNNTASTPSYGTVANNGNFQTWPVITLSTGYSATTCTFTNTSLVGSPVMAFTNMNNGDVIDFAARTVKDSGGVSKYSSVNLGASTGWWYLQPGSNALTKTGGSTVSLSFRDAWI